MVKDTRRLEQLATVTGFVLVVGGVAQWSVPAAYVLAGVLLLVGSVSFRRARS